jgi:hypothetical protein
MEDFDEGPRGRRREGGPRRAFIGSILDITVDQARTMVKWRATGVYVEKPPRKSSRRMRINAVLIEYFQETSRANSDWFKTVSFLGTGTIAFRASAASGGLFWSRPLPSINQAGG